MTGRIVKIWPGRNDTTVLVRDELGVTRACWIDMRDEIGPWLASFCQRATGPVVLTVQPKDVRRGYEITDVALAAPEKDAGTNGVA